MAAIVQARESRRFDDVMFWGVNALILFWLISTSGGIFPVLALGDGTELDEAARSRLRFLLLPNLVVAPLLVLMRFSAVVALLRRNIALVLVLAWIAASLSWSEAPDITGRRLVALLINTMLACYLVTDRSVEQILKILSWCYLILLTASLVFILLLPEVGAMPDGRGLRGAFTHKNGMGEIVSISMIVFFAALRGKAIARWMGWTGMALALLLLLPVGAASSIVVAFIVLMIQAYMLTDSLSFQQRVILLAFASALFFTVAGLMVANLDTMLDLLGRDATLTGRTDIWAYVLHMSGERPWLGYGYGCFWEVERFTSYVMDRFEWAIPSTHNGYLEILLGVGWIGLALFSGFLATMLYRLVMRWRRLQPALAMFAMPMLVFYLLLNVTESTMLGSSGLSWTVMVIAALLLTPGLSTGRTGDGRAS